MNARRISCIFLCIALSLFSSRAFSQWQYLGSFGKPINCVYFLDAVGKPDTGFVGSGTGTYRTTDRGKTWKICGQGAADIFFTTPSHGWMSSGGLYETTDGGLTWRFLGIGSTNVYYNKGKGLLLTEDFMSADNVRWRKPVRPGDVLVIEVELTRRRGNIGKAKGVCKVRGEIVSEAEVTFMLGDGQ